MVAEQSIEDWAQVPWRKREASVYHLQKRIYRASCRGQSAVVHSLQRLLMKSKAARYRPSASFSTEFYSKLWLA